MRAIIIGMGMLASAGSATVQPASAEEVFVDGGRGGISIGVDRGPRERVIERREFRDRDVVRHRDFARGDCRTTIIKRDGYTKKIRRCY